jgi:hypothetical protein
MEVGRGGDHKDPGPQLACKHGLPKEQAILELTVSLWLLRAAHGPWKTDHQASPSPCADGGKGEHQGRDRA